MNHLEFLSIISGLLYKAEHAHQRSRSKAEADKLNEILVTLDKAYALVKEYQKQKENADNELPRN